MATDGAWRANTRRAQYLTRALQLASAAAVHTDLDTCLRTLRAGLIRLGFARAGIWLLEPHDPTSLRGTWGTDWNGAETDERQVVRSIVGSSLGSRRLVAGEKIALGRFAPRSVDSPRPDQVDAVTEGAPNSARVALRADDQLLGLISVDMLPSGRTIGDDQVAALLLLADNVATTVARARAVSAFNETVVRRAVEQAEVESQARDTAWRRELDRLKSEFLMTLSHELRTSLTLVRGYAEVLTLWSERFSPDETRQIASDVLTASATLSQLVDDLLDFSRLERGEIPVHPRPIDLVPLLRYTADALRGVPGSDRLALKLPNALPARADPERTGQCVRNLLTNALRYAPEGPVILQAGQDKLHAWIEVVDRGPGIPPDEQPRVWERFYRGAAIAGFNTVRGAGLGLAMVKTLIEAQGGEVALESAPGRGCTFRIVLPAGE